MGQDALAALETLRSTLRSSALKAGSLEPALEAGRFLGRLNWLNDDGLLSEDALEIALLERHAAELDRHARRRGGEAFDWLHVISTAYIQGGHTRLLENLLAGLSRTGARQAVIVTAAAPDDFRKRAAALAAVRQLEGNFSQRAGGILVEGRGAARIVLHTHPDDLGSALAARALRAEGHRVLFVNHADHVFSYGPGAADSVLEISSWGWRLTAARRAAHAQHFLGIPVEAPTDTPAPTPEGPIMSIGAAKKYRPTAVDGGFPAFLLALLARTDRDVELIGPRETDPWWAEVIEGHPGRVRFRGPLSFAETEVRLREAGAYVDSFPVNGGTAFPQALMANRTVFGPGGDDGGYGLAGALRSPSLAEMTDALLAFLESGREPPRQTQIRRRIAEEFSVEAVTDRLIAAAHGRDVPVPAELAASPRKLDWHAGIWRDRGETAVELHPAPHLPFSTRLQLASRMAGPTLQRRFRSRRLLKWTLRGT